MAKLITEPFSFAPESIQNLVEDVSGAKKYYIKGIFLQGNVKNRNGRIYPIDVLEREVQRYVRTYINENRALGELGHPEGPTINLDKVSHKIESLVREGQNFIGSALVLDTPNGKIVQNLIDAGVKLGVSSRGMGSLKHINGSDRVQDDFQLATAADIVSDPSAPEAFVNGIMENKEWLFADGIWTETHIEQSKQMINEGKILEAFERLMNRLTCRMII